MNASKLPACDRFYLDHNGEDSTAPFELEPSDYITEDDDDPQPSDFTTLFGPDDRDKFQPTAFDGVKRPV